MWRKRELSSSGNDEAAWPEAGAAESGSGVSRRKFIQSAALATGAGMVLKQAVLPGVLYAAPLAAGAVVCATDDKIAATPTFRYRPYRSQATKDVDAVSWVQIDLTAPRNIEEVRLFPANQRMVPGQDAYYAGEGFPVRFKLESANDVDFRDPTVIADHTQTDFENPKDRIVSISSLQGRARYLRLTVTKFPEPEWTRSSVDAPETIPADSAKGDRWFALSRISVLADGKDVAVGRHVSGDGRYSNPDDLQQLTRPERIETEYVFRDRPDYVTDPATWKRVVSAAQAPRSGVTLHGGVFETAMRKNITYLLDSFTVNDLLLQFRERAGKPVPPSSHVPDKFWETDLAGSNAGRFLMGSGNTLRWIDDPELRGRFNAVVEGIAECRQSNGYVMAYPEDTIFYSERGAYTRAWLTHGLIEAGYAGNSQAFQLLRGNYDWFNQCEYLPNLMRGAVQGGQGMIANTRTYLTPVGKPQDVQTIQRHFLEQDWLEALARMEKEQIWQYPYDRPHCYLLTNLEAYLDMYLATGDERWHEGVKAAWEMYNRHWEQPGGSISIIEYNYDSPNSNSLTQKLGEFCGSSFWTFLSQRFQSMAPDQERYAAEIEKSIYNVALANQDGTYGLRYHTILVGKKEKGTRINTCCEGQGTRLLGSLPEHIYLIAPDGVYVNLFEPSTLAWKQNGEPLGLQMDTRFPFENQVKLTVTAAQPTSMKLRVRVPSWATGKMDVAVNAADPIAGEPGTFLVLDRVWNGGDAVTFTLPAGFALAEYTGVDKIAGHKRYSLTYGPLLYAAVGSKDAVLRVPAGAPAEALIHELKPKPGSPLHFTLAGDPNTEFMPYWQVADEEFTCFPVIAFG
jgi:hypothetical protein